MTEPPVAPSPPGATAAPARDRTGARPGPLSPAASAGLVALIAVTGLLCFYGLDGGARFEPIDCWVAQTAREMLDAHDWLVPRCNGETRMQKSPGPYWAVMLVSLIRGTPVDEVCARVPNALAAIGLVLLIFWLTRRIAGERAALFAGFAASASVLILWWSHRGASDLGLTFWTTLALASLWIAVDAEPPGPRQKALLLLGYFAAGLGMLYKMPMPLVVVGLPAVCYVLLRRDREESLGEQRTIPAWGARVPTFLRDRLAIFRSPWHLLGLGLFLLPWLPWAIAVSQAEDAALLKWKVEFLDRYTGALPNVEDQGKLAFLFTYLIPPLLYCAPFSLSLPEAIGRAFRRQAGVQRNGTLLMLIWFLSLLVFFTSSRGKEVRYFLPALPPLFVLLGIELARLFDPRRPVHPGRLRLITLLICTLLPLGLGLGGYFGLHTWWVRRGQWDLAGLYDWRHVWQIGALTGLILAVGFGLAAVLFQRRRTHASFATLCGTMYVLWLWAWPQVLPLFMSERPMVDFAQQLADPARVASAERAQLRYVGSQDPRLTWYSDVRIPRLLDQLALLREQHGRRNLDYEKRRYAEEMLRRLAADEPVLLLAGLPDYLQFRIGASREYTRRGQPLPPLYVWLTSRYGREDAQFVLLGNRPPRWPEPEVRLSADVLKRFAEKGVTWPPPWPTSAAAEPARPPSVTEEPPRAP